MEEIYGVDIAFKGIHRGDSTPTLIQVVLDGL
jgi:hypothetical protein